MPLPAWLQSFRWHWICHGKIFKFLGIPFAFYGEPAQLWNYVISKVEKKLEYWMPKKLSLARKFQIYSKVLATTHVYYSSCWDPSKACYNKLDKLLKQFFWSSSLEKRGFHGVAWEFCCLPKECGGMGLFDCKRQGVALCAK